MDGERLERLRGRLYRAQQLANDIKTLNDSKMDRSRLIFSMRTQRDDRELLHGDLMADIIEIGREAMLAQKEAELETLLSVEPQIGPIASSAESVRRILPVTG